MATKLKPGDPRLAWAVDDESRGIIYEGITQTQISELLKMDRRVVMRKLHGVKPKGQRNGYDIYDVRAVMPYLVDPAYNVDEAIMRMNHADLPKQLTKEYWAGKRARQEYEFKAGNLWQTEKVIEKVSELFKIVRMQVLLTSDTVERNQELTPKQRDVIKSEMDGLLRNLKDAIKRDFGTMKVKPVETEEDDDEL